jgi:hypothetical protein
MSVSKVKINREPSWLNSKSHLVDQGKQMDALSGRLDATGGKAEEAQAIRSNGLLIISQVLKTA